MSITPVQGASGSGIGTAVTLAFGSNVTSGNNIIAVVDVVLGTGVTPTTITDSQSNTYTKVATVTLTATGGQVHVISWWLATGITGGADTLTFNCGSSSFLVLNIAEYNSTSPLAFDQSNTGTSAGISGTVTSGNITTTKPNSVLVAYGLYPGSTTVSAGSGYTLRAHTQNDPDFGYSFGIEDQVVSSTGTYSASIVFGAASNNSVIAIANFGYAPPPLPQGVVVCVMGM